MIFIVTGTTDHPFNRLITMVSKAVEQGIIQEEVIIQSGTCSQKAPGVRLIPFIEKDQFDWYFQEASLIIAHAGMGVIFTALDMQKPLIIVPRESEQGEHVNNHQVDTAEAMHAMVGVPVCRNFDQLKKVLADKQRVTPLAVQDQVSLIEGDISEHVNTYAEGCLYPGKVKISNSLGQAVAELIGNESVVITASAGGHMVQLMRLVRQIEAAPGMSTTPGMSSTPGMSTTSEAGLPISHIITTNELQRKSLEKQGGTVFIIGECTRRTLWQMVKVFFQSRKLAKKVQPKVVLSTGALPSAFFCYHAYKRGARIIWVDSIANVKRLSMSGRFVQRFAQAVFTQWPALADDSLSQGIQGKSQSRSKSKIQYTGNLI